MPLVKWDVVMQQKSAGGLGVGDLAVKNVALLFKWWWRFADEEEPLWKKVIQSIHKEGKGIIPSSSVTRYTGPWQTVKKMINDKQPMSIKFMQNLQVEVGDGERTKFWKDPWIQNGLIMNLFLDLYAISSQQNTVIASMGWFEGQVWN